MLVEPRNRREIGNMGGNVMRITQDVYIGVCFILVQLFDSPVFVGVTGGVCQPYGVWCKRCGANHVVPSVWCRGPSMTP